MKKKYPIIVLTLLVFTLVSCTDTYDICELPRTVTFQAGFYQKISGVESPASAPNFDLTLIGASSSIYINQQNTSQFGLGLNPLVDSASYYIKLGFSLPADTITLVYSSQSVLISPECGNIFTHTLLRTRTTYNTIDSLKIVAPAINTTSIENLKIYF